MLAFLLLLSMVLPWEEQGAQLRLLNSEATRDKAYVLVHLELTPTIDVAAFRWQGLAEVHNHKGEPLPQAGDCGLDMRRTTGPFPLRKGRKHRLLLYFFASRDDFPVEVLVQGQVVQTHR